MTALVIDHGAHGALVTASMRTTFDGAIERFELSSDAVTLAEIRAALAEALDRRPTAVNLSFGGGNTRDCASLADMGAEAEFRALFKAGIPVFVAAGNAGAQFADGVSVLASSPFNLAIGARASTGDRFEAYSQRSPLLSNFSHLGQTPDGGARGTSFATPRACGMAATVLETGRDMVSVLAGMSRAAWIFRAGAADWYQALDRTIAAPGTPPALDGVWTLLAAYEAILGRQPDLEGLNFWAGEARRHGVAPVVRALVGEAGRQRLYNLDRVSVLERMTSMYVLYFGRLPDLGGLAWWIGRITGRGLDYTDGFLRGSDIDWRRVTEAFLHDAGSEDRARLRFADLAEDLIASPTPAPADAAAACACTVPKRYTPCD